MIVNHDVTSRFKDKVLEMKLNYTSDLELLNHLIQLIFKILNNNLIITSNGVQGRLNDSYIVSFKKN